MGWYIEYYAFNQITNDLERKRMRVNKERKKARTFAEFRSITTQMIIEINCKLQSGWSPFAVTSTQTMFQQPAFQPTFQPMSAVPVTQPVQMSSAPAPAPMDDGSIYLTAMTDKFIKVKERELSENTMRSYRSFCSNFKKWIQEHYPTMRTSEFTKRIAVKYMDHVLEGKNANKNGKARKHDDGTVSNRTYNNNLKQGRALFSWAVERCYCEKNPFAEIKVKREEKKSRVIIPEQWRKKIREYFEKNNPQYLIICELVHSSLIRPVEISRLQAYMVNFNESCIDMPASITKNHMERRARLSDELREMLSRHIMGAKPEDYLFADKCWRCGKVPMSSHTYGNVWEAMRKDTKLPQEMQLYSLRDTGINGMLKAGIDPLSVMQAADHHDLAMTTRYANHADPELISKLNELAPKF